MLNLAGCKSETLLARSARRRHSLLCQPSDGQNTNSKSTSPVLCRLVKKNRIELRLKGWITKQTLADEMKLGKRLQLRSPLCLFRIPVVGKHGCRGLAWLNLNERWIVSLYYLAVLTLLSFRLRFIARGCNVAAEQSPTTAMGF
jgi:hypothetical protein